MTTTIDAGTLTRRLLAALAITLGLRLVEVRTLDGIGRQIIDVYRGDEKLARVEHRGTVRQARAKALLDQLHDTHPSYATVVAIYRGQ